MGDKVSVPGKQKGAKKPITSNGKRKDPEPNIKKAGSKTSKKSQSSSSDYNIEMTPYD